jgi:hypothetical protein
VSAAPRGAIAHCHARMLTRRLREPLNSMTLLELSGIEVFSGPKFSQPDFSQQTLSEPDFSEPQFE